MVGQKENREKEGREEERRKKVISILFSERGIPIYPNPLKYLTYAI